MARTRGGEEKEMTDYINVGLYGDGSRKAHLRAEYIYCENCDKCSLYKEGKCYNVTTLFGSYCNKGRVSRVDLGTKQSSKYYANYDSTKKDTKYAKLKYPDNIYIFTVNNFIGLKIPFVDFKKDEELNRILITDPLIFSSNIFFMEKEQFTTNLIKRICENKPRTLFDNSPIKKYTMETIPEFLRQLSQCLPDTYKKFIEEFPEYATTIENINYVGRKAYLNTCNLDKEFTDQYGNVFIVEGENLVGTIKKGCFLSFSSKEFLATIPITDELIVTISDNSQVLPTTKFVN